MNKFFKFFLVKEIISKDGILHFRRYCILPLYFINIYIHRIYQSDNDEHYHNHPWNYFVLILKGSYIEKSYNGYYNTKLMKATNFVFSNKYRFHKIYKLLSNNVTTLFITTKNTNNWGYLVDGRFVDNKTYRKNKNEKNTRV